MKTCKDCGIEKPFDQYSYHPHTSDNCQSYCNPCFNARKRRNEKEWRERNPEKYKASKRRSTVAKYGLTTEQYDEMYANQEGRCKICERWFDTLAIDHCHETDEIRGLLCGACNQGLGHFGDSIEDLASAIKYLREYQTLPELEK